MKVQLPDEIIPEMKVVQARSDIFYEAELMETVKVKAGKFSKTGKDEIAFCYLCHDLDKKEYISTAETIEWTKKSSKLLSFLTAIIGKTVRPQNLPADFDLDWILHKHFSIKFLAASEGYPKIGVRQYRSPQKCTTLNAAAYQRPTWLAARIISEETETFDGDVSDVLQGLPAAIAVTVQEEVVAPVVEEVSAEVSASDFIAATVDEAPEKDEGDSDKGLYDIDIDLTL